MSAKRVEYHQGAIADAKSAAAWYQKRSPKAALDFVEELHRAADTIREAPERWPLGKNKQHETIRALAISFFHYLFGARIRNHNLGDRSRQQAAGVLDTPPLVGVLAGICVGVRGIFIPRQAALVLGAPAASN